jgi:hypothetical protein
VLARQWDAVADNILRVATRGNIAELDNFNAGGGVPVRDRRG